MICCDIDGTLLDSKHRIPDRVKEAVRKAVEEGILFVLVSARTPEAVRPIQMELGIRGITVCYAGACIVEDRQVLYSQAIEAEVAKKICDIAGKYGLSISLFRGREWFVEQMDDHIQLEIDITRVFPQITSIHHILQQCIQEKAGINKIMLTASTEKVREVGEILSAIPELQVQIGYSKDNYLEIIPMETSKGNAVKKLCELKDINPQNVIAIGDENLDISMIQYAGMGVAMGNAIEELKQAADFTTRTNDEAGVAYALERFVLKNAD